MSSQLANFLIVGAVLFALGVLGFLTRRNLIVMFLSAELMLQGVSINLVAFAIHHGNWQGQAFVIFILTVAAAEAALALALVSVLFRRGRSLDSSAWQDLREPEQPPMPDDELPEPEAPAPEWPHLTPAGIEPPPDGEMERRREGEREKEETEKQTGLAPRTPAQPITTGDLPREESTDERR